MGSAGQRKGPLSFLKVMEIANVIACPFPGSPLADPRFPANAGRATLRAGKMGYLNSCGPVLPNNRSGET